MILSDEIEIGVIDALFYLDCAPAVVMAQRLLPAPQPQPQTEQAPNGEPHANR